MTLSDSEGTRMTTLAAAQSPTHNHASGLAASVRRIAGSFEARALETEALGTMPPDLVAEVRAAGLFRLLQPRALGGLELPPAEALAILTELCRADASNGWTTLIRVGGNAFASWLDPAVARATLGDDADVTTAAVFAPTGRAEPVDGGFRVGGRWPFASGSSHAEWFFNGAFVFDGDTPRMLSG